MPVRSPKQVEKILKKHGFILQRQSGSHRTFLNLKTEKVTVVPMHSRDLATGTLRSIIKQAGLTVEDFK